MHLAIDARFVGPKQTGLGRYTEELLHALEKIDQRNRYTVLLRQEGMDYYYPQAANFKTVLADYQWYTLAEQRSMPKVLHRYQPDLVHFCHFNIPVFYRRPFVVTVHDLIKAEFKGQESTTRSPLIYALKHRAFSFVCRHAILRSLRILTPSGATKAKIVKRYHVPDDKIVVTYEAADPRFARYRRLEVSAADRERLTRQYGLRYPFLLYVGNAYPYKNLDRLLSALRKLDPSLSFVNPCARSVFYDRLARTAREMGLEKRVILPGFVPDQDLALFYRLAALYVFPSLSEGFGLPLLEAQMAGLPVAASRAAPLPEVGGAGAAYFDPYDVDDIARQIDRVGHDLQLRRQLITAGEANVRKFSWAETARRTLDVYQKALNARE